jgi:hypothetical protein
MKILHLSNLTKTLKRVLQLLTVFIGFAFIGWLMNGFNAPFIVCLCTLVVCCYLAWVGSGGIALASVWVVGLMSIAAINQHWLHDIPRPKFRYIPLLLLANWQLALAVVWQLGKVSDLFRQSYSHRIRVFSGLIGLVTVGLLSGWRLYPETLLYLTVLTL